MTDRNDNRRNGEAPEDLASIVSWVLDAAFARSPSAGADPDESSARARRHGEEPARGERRGPAPMAAERGLVSVPSATADGPVRTRPDGSRPARERR